MSGTDSEGSGSTVPAKSGMDAHAGGRERDNHLVRGGLSSGSVLGKRQEPEGGTSSGDSGATDMKEHIMRLSRDNKQLKSALSKSQEEVKKLKSVIEMHELQTKKSSKDDSKAATRYWTDAEHQRFLDALQAHGPKDVKAIAQQVGTRSATQVRTHAQKYFIKLARMKKSSEEAAKAGVPASAHGAWWLQVCPSQLPISASRRTHCKSPRLWATQGKRRVHPCCQSGANLRELDAALIFPCVRMRSHTNTLAGKQPVSRTWIQGRGT